MSNYHEILGVSPSATQEEITKAYKKLALKYHPDRNRGNEKWANEKFTEVGEAYNALLTPSATSKPRKNYDFSGKSSAEKFKMAFEMMAEMNKNFDRMEEDLNSVEESLNRERERLWSEAIRNMEENLTLAGVSSSDLDSSLWSPYSDWKEKVRNSFDSSLEIFLSNMRIAINNAEWEKKKNYSTNNQRERERERERDLIMTILAMIILRIKKAEAEITKNPVKITILMQIPLNI